MGDQNNHDRSNCEQCLRDDLETANERIAELTEQRDELLVALKAVESDLVQRAEMEDDGYGMVLNISNGVLQKMHAAIAKAEKK